MPLIRSGRSFGILRSQIKNAIPANLQAIGIQPFAEYQFLNASTISLEAGTDEPDTILDLSGNDHTLTRFGVVGDSSVGRIPATWNFATGLTLNGMDGPDRPSNTSAYRFANGATTFNTASFVMVGRVRSKTSGTRGAHGVIGARSGIGDDYIFLTGANTSLSGNYAVSFDGARSTTGRISVNGGAFSATAENAIYAGGPGNQIPENTYLIIYGDIISTDYIDTNNLLFGNVRSGLSHLGFAGDVEYMAIFDTAGPNPTEVLIDKIVGLAAHKTRRTALLPIDHPYKVIPPPEQRLPLTFSVSGLQQIDHQLISVNSADLPNKLIGLAESIKPQHLSDSYLQGREDFYTNRFNTGHRTVTSTSARTRYYQGLWDAGDPSVNAGETREDYTARMVAIAPTLEEYLARYYQPFVDRSGQFQQRNNYELLTPERAADKVLSTFARARIVDQWQRLRWPMMDYQRAEIRIVQIRVRTTNFAAANHTASVRVSGGSLRVPGAVDRSTDNVEVWEVPSAITTLTVFDPYDGINSSIVECRKETQESTGSMNVYEMLIYYHTPVQITHEENTPAPGDKIIIPDPAPEAWLAPGVYVVDFNDEVKGFQATAETDTGIERDARSWRLDNPANADLGLVPEIGSRDSSAFVWRAFNTPVSSFMSFYDGSGTGEGISYVQVREDKLYFGFKPGNTGRITFRTQVVSGEEIEAANLNLEFPGGTTLPYMLNVKKFLNRIPGVSVARMQRNPPTIDGATNEPFPDDSDARAAVLAKVNDAATASEVGDLFSVREVDPALWAAQQQTLFNNRPVGGYTTVEEMAAVLPSEGWNYAIADEYSLNNVLFVDTAPPGDVVHALGRANFVGISFTVDGLTEETEVCIGLTDLTRSTYPPEPEVTIVI